MMAPAAPFQRATPSWMSTRTRDRFKGGVGRGECVEVHGGGEAALGREAQGAALGMPGRVGAVRPVRRIGEQPEPQPVGIHQQTSGATGTATASASAKGLGSARRLLGSAFARGAVDDQHREQLGQLPVFKRQRLRRIGGVARQQAPLRAVLAVGAAEQVDASDFEDPGHARDLDFDSALAHVAAERPAAAVDATGRQRPQQPLQRFAHGKERCVAVVAFANRDGGREAERHVLAANHVELGGQRRGAPKDVRAGAR